MKNRKKAAESHETEDVLGAYPGKMQIAAIPERRYLKTSRLLAITTFINLGLLLALAGIFVYLVARLDVVVANQRVVNMYTMDPERQVIQASEYSTKAVPALQLMMEQAMRDYILNRHTVVWDANEQQYRWSGAGAVGQYSERNLYQNFIREAQLMFNDTRARHIVKDVHLYSLKLTGANIWEGIFDVFDMPVPDIFNPVCNCSDNTPDCLACKEKNALGHQRFRVYIRSNFNAPKSLLNPLGILVLNYDQLYIPIDPKEKFWNLPSVLRPEL